MYELTAEITFDSAHHLREYNGACANMHGHQWKVQICITGEKLDKVGILMDFKEIKRILKEQVHDIFDHKCLNDLEQFSTQNPTAENISRYIWNVLSDEVYKISNNDCKLKWVQVYETPTSVCRYFESNK